MRGHITADTLRRAHGGYSKAGRATNYAPPGFKKLSEEELVQT